MRVLVRDGNDLIDSQDFEPRRLTLGSGEACDIRLRDRRIQPTLASLVPGPHGTWSIESAGPGTVALNRHPVTHLTPVNHADEITVLNYTIVVHRSSDGEFPDKASPKTMITEEASQLRARPLPAGAVIKHDNDRLELSGDRKAWLARLNQPLRKCADIPKLIDLALDTMLDEFAGRIAYVAARRRNYGAHEFVQGRGMDGKPVGEPASFDSFLFRCTETKQYLCLPQTGEPDIGSALVVPMSCQHGELGILYVDRKKGATPFSADDLDLLTLIAAMFAAQLECIVQGQIDIQEAVELEKLSFVREIQARMDPTVVPQWPGLQLAVYCKPGSERGGDIYFVMRFPNHLAGILVAHLAGEATRSALAMAEVRAAFRIAGLHADPPHIFLRSINWMLCEDRHPCFMHAIAVVLNPKTGALEYSTAGNVRGLIVDGRGDARDLGDRSVIEVGRTPGFAYGPQKERLQHAETLVLYTDGCHTVRDNSGTQLGEERLVESIGDGFGQSATTALDELIQDHAAFFKNGAQPDDITILLFHRIDVPA